VVLRIGTLRVMRNDRIVGLEGIICLGSVILVVYTPAWLRTEPTPDVLYGLTGRAEAAPNIRQMWPTQGEAIPWPPEQVLDVEDVEHIWPDNMVVLLQLEE
jgi:hypothetical protein